VLPGWLAAMTMVPAPVIVRVSPAILAGPERMVKVMGRLEVDLAARAVGFAPKVTGLGGQVKVMV